MERLIKIIATITFVALSLFTNAWAIALCTCLLLSLAYFKKSIRWQLIILLPIFSATTSFVGGSTIGVIIGLIEIYLVKFLCGETCFNHTKDWGFWLLSSIGAYLYLPYILIIPLVTLVISMPTPTIVIKPLKHRILGLTIALSLLLASHLFCWCGFTMQRKRAYLQKGVWAQATVPYSLENLRNASSYSYSEFVQIMNADTISTLSDLSQYNELWIITPTTPFSDTEIQTLKKWVASGGNLILVSDHTDLYGHARCINQIATVFNCKVHYSATFDKRNNQIFRNAYAAPVDIKTGANMSGYVFPMLSTWEWEEDAYYSNANFFGPLAISGDDSFGDKLLLGQKSYGLGQVSFLQDSTIFSNFAVYQPYIVDLAKCLSCHSFLARLYALLPMLLLLALYLIVTSQTRWVALFVLFMPYCYPFYNTMDAYYGTNPQRWSGNPNFILEDRCPYTNISTAYSLASLSNRKPLWINDIDISMSDVIWVDTVPPPNKDWRWIKLEDKHYAFQQSGTAWDSLYVLMDVPFIKTWSDINSNYKLLSANSVFSDRVMNDWWYNDGISTARRLRIKAWLAWLDKSELDIPPVLYDSSKFTTEIFDAIIHIEKKAPIMVRLPRPKVSDEEEVYLGNGISAVTIIHGDTLSLLGKASFAENINSPKLWAIDYLPNM